MIYEVDSLPALIEIGVQSEKGVRDIPFHVKSWMDEFDGIKFEVMVTPAGAKAAHLAASTLIGDVLYWHVSDSDTIRGGEGKVEILGHLPDKRKLSGWAATKIRETSTLATAEPPEVERPYYEAILEAADRIEKAVVPDAYQSDMAEDDASRGAFVRHRTHYDVKGQSWPDGAAVEEGAPSAEIHKADGTLGAVRWVKVGHAPEAESLVGHCKLSSVGMVTEENILDRSESGYLLGREYESTSTTGVTRTLRSVSAVVCLKAGYSANGWPLTETLDNLSTATIPEPGLYLAVRGDGTVYRGYELQPYTKPLEDRFIPSTVTRNSEVQPLVSSERINGLIDDKLSIFGQAVCLPVMVLGDGVGSPILKNPWAAEIHAGKNYIIVYNGKTYHLTAVTMPDSPVGAVVLGNGENAGRPDLNPKLPFVVSAVSNSVGAQLGSYGSVAFYDDADIHTITIYEASRKGYYYYDGDDTARLVGIKELRQALIDAGNPVIILPETTVQGEDGQMFLTTALAADPEAGVTYKVTYNGTAYDCPALAYATDDMSGVMLGNSDALGLVGGNPDAPFVALLMPGGTDGNDGTIYGLVMDMTGANSATISILEEASGPEYMTRTQVVELINEMTGGGGGGGDATTDVFYTADGQVFTTLDGAVMHVRKGEQNG